MPGENDAAAKQDLELGTEAHRLQEAANACRFQGLADARCTGWRSSNQVPGLNHGSRS